MKIRVRVTVSGLVQGVGFRYAVRREASLAGVRGYVKNLPNGKVEAVFEGEESKVMELVGFCEQGPPGADVSGINVKKEGFADEFISFEIRY
ncbi:MAG: acylphosphatase [Candidatus Aenigmarchaeota archaeon]|nr:acylphosphatase [Candidatus Aenigmarchaeota archaeon]